MPLFRRCDGDPVQGEAAVRRLLPFLMPRRNDCAIYHEARYDITAARAWLRRFNRARADRQPATLFHLFLWASGQMLALRPGLNRFVSGRRLYQRRGVQLSFAAKREMADESPLVTVKLPVVRDEPFDRWVARVVAAIALGRGPGTRPVDREIALAMKLPGWLLAAALAALRWLDRANLAPRWMIDADPLYTSLFVANLGSVGLDRTFHHLYEGGTASLFAALGRPRKQMLPGRDGRETPRDVLEVRFTLDERINDGLYAARTLEMLRGILEDPAGRVPLAVPLLEDRPALPVAAAGAGSWVAGAGGLGRGQGAVDGSAPAPSRTPGPAMDS